MAQHAVIAVKLWSSEKGHYEAYGTPDLQVSRVPCVGEIIDLPYDEVGRQALYCRVAIVLHEPKDHGDTDAEIYGVLVSFEDLLARAPDLADSPG